MYTNAYINKYLYQFRKDKDWWFFWDMFMLKVTTYITRINSLIQDF